jgi:hypothetical protein
MKRQSMHVRYELRLVLQVLDSRGRVVEEEIAGIFTQTLSERASKPAKYTAATMRKRYASDGALSIAGKELGTSSPVVFGNASHGFAKGDTVRIEGLRRGKKLNKRSFRVVE